MIKISGNINNIIYRNENNYWTVLSITNNDIEYVLVGYLFYVDVGLKIEAEVNKKYNDKFGLQYEIINYNIGMPNDNDAIINVLSMSNIKGIGVVIAKRLVDNFGEDTFDVILNSKELLYNIKGMTKNRIDNLVDALTNKYNEIQTFLYLKKLGFGNILIKKIYKLYGNNSEKIINNNPYILNEEINGIGFNTCDKIAINLGFDINSDERLNSAIIYLIKTSYFNGNVFISKNQLYNQLKEFLKFENINKFDDLLVNLQMNQKIKIIKVNTDEDVRIYLKKAFNIEYNLTNMLYSIKNNINIITGGPGTGKTHNIIEIIEKSKKEGLKVLCCAPTGRAAQRMAEVTKFKSKTIHRTLEINSDSIDNDIFSNSNFGYSDENKLDCDVLIVDEVSMVDEYLMYCLIKAVHKETKIYLVGDVDQLPSVSAGNVLFDMIESNWFNVKKLEKIYRQSNNSHIVGFAHKINKGIRFDLENFDDFKYVNNENETNINIIISKLTSKKIPEYFNISQDSIQVLCVTKKYTCGSENLNVILQNAINPKSNNKNEIKYNDKIFRENDKVMQVVNNYMLEYNVYDENGLKLDSGTGIFNGDIGFIKSIDIKLNSMKVMFDDKEVIYYIDDFDNLALAYAITVHKSQGSEYDVVVMPLVDANKQLLNRKILYTAITRAKKCICFVGKKQIFYKMVDNQYENKRNSALCDQFYIP